MILTAGLEHPYHRESDTVFDIVTEISVVPADKEDLLPDKTPTSVCSVTWACYFFFHIGSFICKIKFLNFFLTFLGVYTLLSAASLTAWI